MRKDLKQAKEELIANEVMSKPEVTKESIELILNDYKFHTTSTITDRIHALINGKEQPKVTELREQLALLKGAAKADEERLIEAAKKAGITYMDCDTPDWLSEKVVELQADLARVKGELVEAKKCDDAKADEIQRLLPFEFRCEDLETRNKALENDIERLSMDRASYVYCQEAIHQIPDLGDNESYMCAVERIVNTNNLQRNWLLEHCDHIDDCLGPDPSTGRTCICGLDEILKGEE